MASSFNLDTERFTNYIELTQELSSCYSAYCADLRGRVEAESRYAQALIQRCAYQKRDLTLKENEEIVAAKLGLQEVYQNLPGKTDKLFGQIQGFLVGALETRGKIYCAYQRACQRGEPNHEVYRPLLKEMDQVLTRFQTDLQLIRNSGAETQAVLHQYLSS